MSRGRRTLNLSPGFAPKRLLPKKSHNVSYRWGRFAAFKLKYQEKERGVMLSCGSMQWQLKHTLFGRCEATGWAESLICGSAFWHRQGRSWWIVDGLICCVSAKHLKFLCEQLFTDDPTTFDLTGRLWLIHQADSFSREGREHWQLKDDGMPLFNNHITKEPVLFYKHLTLLS